VPAKGVGRNDPVIYVKASLTALGAAFVVLLYTSFVMAFRTKTTGRGALIFYFGDPLLWITVIVVCIYVFRLTIQK